MASERRVKRLRDLVAQIELLPPSPDRDRLLSEFRSRAVDVDSGVKPRAMLPMREPVVAPVPRTPPRRETTPSITRSASSAWARAVAPARPASIAGRSDNPAEPFCADDWFSSSDSLDISPRRDVGTQGEQGVASWKLGLRG